MFNLDTVHRTSLIAVLLSAVALTGCLSEVGGEGLTEEELAGDGDPGFVEGDEGAEGDGLLIESAVGVSGALTLWDDNGYSDTRQVRYSYDSNFGNDGFNDKASSISNRTPNYWMLYWNDNYGGLRVCIRPYSRVSNLKDADFQISGFWFDMNDVISSVKEMTTSTASCSDADAFIGYR